MLDAEGEPKPEDLRRVNAIFQRAAENAKDDAGTLKEVADYFAASQQIQDAIPLYLRVLELEPEDSNAREKLATGFVQTNQRERAIEMLQEIIKQTPEKYQPYDLLAQLLDDEGRALQRANQLEPAKAQFAKAAASYEQSLLINPNHAQTYLRLAELLLGPLRQAERAETMLTEARLRFPQAPQFTYFLANRTPRGQARAAGRDHLRRSVAGGGREPARTASTPASFSITVSPLIKPDFRTRRPIFSGARLLSIPRTPPMPATTSATCGRRKTCTSMKPRR